MSAEQELAKLEARVLDGKRLAAFLAAVDAIRQAGNDPKVRERILALTAPNLTADLVAALAEAFAAGVDDALSITGKPKARPRGLPAALISSAASMQATIVDELAKAKKLARAGADLDVTLSPLFASANAALRGTTSLVNNAGNAGSTAVADAAGYATVWVAETNACVHCLAYSGRVAQPGKTFPGGLTYGPKSYFPDALPHPPLHANCRCTVEPLRAQEFADALRREADRSVLRGFSLESESMKVRIDAARRLLADPNLVAPKSVIDFARRAVRDGAFPTRGRP